jgi:hypothetical protein
LALIEDKGILTDIDENVWIGILIGCSVNGGVFMRKIASVIYDCLVNSCDCIPNLYTTGYYMKSISAKKNAKYLDDNNTIINNKYVDIFFYLEEIGLTWILQSYALMKQEVTIDRVITTSSNSSPMNPRFVSSFNYYLYKFISLLFILLLLLLIVLLHLNPTALGVVCRNNGIM